MGLKSSIVIVNEYTTKTKNGGTRGATPGDYTVRYMARKGATEILTPVHLMENEGYATRYMARKEATEVCHSIPEIKEQMKKAQGYGGVAFSEDDLSLSHAKLKRKSRNVQRAFNTGKTVLKTIISFDEEYLRKYGIIDDTFVCKKSGDYRGNIDQMKLRMAINNGFSKMARDYDDLKWVGVIQVDTKHVHCHLTLYDNGLGNIAADGKQKGKISEKSKRSFRRGVDMFLDQNQTVRMMSSNVTQDKRNALCFIKKYTHATMNEHGVPQFILACLPANKQLWRANTNRAEMKKANAIVKEYVIQVLNQPDSGYQEAMSHIYEYAMSRKLNEDLSGQEYRQLIKQGQDRVIDDCMNGVYAVLKQIPDEKKQTMTPMLSTMSMPYEDMAAEIEKDPMVEFGFKLCSYSARLDHHRKERHKYHGFKEAYENSSNISLDSRPLLDFYKIEEEYHARLMCKYQHFLSFLPPEDEYADEFKDLMDYKAKMKALQQLKDDPSPRRMQPDSAEDYGLRVYNQHGGRYAASSPHVLENRLDLMSCTYQEKELAFRLKLADYGLTLDKKGVSTKKPYEFDQIKAFDLHHLAYDFAHDIPVSKVNIDAFAEMANTRYGAFCGAKNYLQKTGQADAVKNFSEADIRIMKELADQLLEQPILPSKKPIGGSVKRSKTVSLDVDFRKHMGLAVKAIVQSVQMDNS